MLKTILEPIFNLREMRKFFLMAFIGVLSFVTQLKLIHSNWQKWQNDTFSAFQIFQVKVSNGSKAFDHSNILVNWYISILKTTIPLLSLKSECSDIQWCRAIYIPTKVRADSGLSPLTDTKSNGMVHNTRDREVSIRESSQRKLQSWQ